MKYKILSAMITLALLPLTSNAASISAEKAVQDLKLTELAQTYSPEKIASVTGSQNASKFDAVLIDIGALSTDDLNNNKAKADKLDSFVEDQLNLNENYIGNVSDKNIAERIRKEWSVSTALQDDATLDTLNSFIDKGYTTGYNVIKLTDKSNFNEELMLRYGHSDIDHAIQLIYLMKSEGFDPKVQFTPKSSAFIYLPEWGEASYPVYTLDSGKMIAVVKEYNLDFEFRTIEAKNEFMTLINKYAKKDSADEQGLLIESWWQPFYRSYTPMKGYEILTENRVMIGDYQADLMSLPQTAEKQEQGIKATAKSFTVQPAKVWVNPSFYRYMNGEYK